jgi:hypothetical protein
MHCSGLISFTSFGLYHQPFRSHDGPGATCNRALDAANVATNRNAGSIELPTRIAEDPKTWIGIDPPGPISRLSKAILTVRPHPHVRDPLP